MKKLPNIRCETCNQVLPRAAFSWNANHGGPCYSCKACSQKRREMYAKAPKIFIGNRWRVDRAAGAGNQATQEN